VSRTRKDVRAKLVAKEDSRPHKLRVARVRVMVPRGMHQAIIRALMGLVPIEAGPPQQPEWDIHYQVYVDTIEPLREFNRR
jgi:hypothetical protein